MLKLLQFLWTGCWHNWQFTQKQDIYERDVNGKLSQLPIGEKWYFTCSKCSCGKTQKMGY